jgi:catechol 2,3-dioxygenase-like lactoylglutathione lyase family enzyme
MKVKRIVANITTDDIAAAQRFYGDVLGHDRWEEDEDHTNAWATRPITMRPRPRSVGDGGPD